MPPHDVSPLQGKLLELLARLQGARAILELGTLGGYSTIWLARALPADGRLVTLEASPLYAEVARANVDRAGFAGLVDVRAGPALDALPHLVDEGPFDVVFIDADKRSNPEYLEWALRLTRVGLRFANCAGFLPLSESDPAQFDLRRPRSERGVIGLTAPDAGQTRGRLPQSRLRMGPELDSATVTSSAALSGYAYAYRYAWRFS